MTDEQIESVQDMLSSSGWALLWAVVIPPRLAGAQRAANAAVGVQDITTANRELGRRDGMIEVAREAYQAVGEIPPDRFLKEKGS